MSHVAVPRNRLGNRLRPLLPRLAVLLGLLTGPIQAVAEPPGRSIKARIVAHARENGFNGTILVERDGRILFHRSFGLADRAFAVPARNDTRYRVASITKLFTAVIVLRLAERGLVDLEAPIGRYLPDWPGEGADRVRVHQLLNHTSGLAQFDRVQSLEQALNEGIGQYQRPQTPAGLLRDCCGGPLARAPGTAFDYNNADYIALGRMIERLTGQSFEQALRSEILDPLELRDTGIARQAEIVPRLAPTYYWRGDGEGWMNDLPVYFENWNAAGAAYADADDLLRFSRALFGGSLVAAESLDRMLTPGLDDYGYGLWSYSFGRGGRTHRVAKRPGSIMGANAVLYRLLDERATVILLANTNRADLDVFAQRVGEWLVGASPG